ncbi:NB-ARC [Dillenia turbinata]|uniref:NB-ARC n=1 Tax=Dillenia turbinata TaxID=194707 RepID=A0AAN8UP36_9MAGN
MERKFMTFGMGGPSSSKTAKITSLKSFADSSQSVDTFPTRRLVGETTTKATMEKIWEGVMDDDVSIIGVWGMGGIGKTTLVMHIYNRLLEYKNKALKSVYWVTVSQAFNISKLQNDIANALRLDLSYVEEDKIRAAKLFKALSGDKSFVLILDDVRKGFALEDIGIPIGKKRSKLILTTRMLDVCRWMGCHRTIKVAPLIPEVSWELFLENLGHHQILDTEIKQIAYSIANECAGLPLAIIAMAKSMAGVEDIHEWRDALAKIKEPKGLDEEDLVFDQLRFSYDRLPNRRTQHCLLYCALFPEDYKIPRKTLIGYLVVEGIIEGKSWQAQFDEGFTILNKLENASLLESAVNDWGERSVKMHDMIRDMALRITCSKFMVKAGAGLLEVPDLQYWSQDLEKVSLIRNHLSELSSSMSPRCHKLSTLLLSENVTLKKIADAFFVNMQSLRILDLCSTGIESLPHSISTLKNLTALLLRHCNQLKFIPSLENVTALMKLDLCGAGVSKIPDGMDMLVNLRILNISGTKIQALPEGLLSKLSHLQCLIVMGTAKCLTVRAQEVLSLPKLEILWCRFENGHDYNRCLRLLYQRKGLRNYYIVVGGSHVSAANVDEYLLREEVVLNGMSFTGEGCSLVVLPKNIKRLEIREFNHINSILDVWSTAFSSSSREDEWCNPLQSLEILRLYSLESLRELLPVEIWVPANTFSLLKWISIHNCPKIKKLFPPGFLPRLQSLECLDVYDCENMEKIFAEEEVGESSNLCNVLMFFTLPKLQIFTLYGLPELKSICHRIISCDSIKEINVDDCPKLKVPPLLSGKSMVNASPNLSHEV